MLGMVAGTALARTTISSDRAESPPTRRAIVLAHRLVTAIALLLAIMLLLFPTPAATALQRHR